MFYMYAPSFVMKRLCEVANTYIPVADLGGGLGGIQKTQCVGIKMH